MTYAKNRRQKKIKGISLPDLTINSFKGINTSIKNQRDLPHGTAVDSLNWITGVSKDSQGQVYGDHIELRRGMALLGTTRQTGNGHISGIGVGILSTGIEVPFYTFTNKLYYYNSVLADTADTTLVIPTTAQNDDFAVNGYSNLAGTMLYVSSPNSGVYKIPVANPTSPLTLSSAIQGYFKINQNRTFMWNTYSPSSLVKDTTDVAVSYVDKTQLSQYASSGNTTTQGTGDGVIKLFTNTLALGGGQTIFGLSIGGAVASALTISAITQAASGKVTTTAPHGLTQGQQITFWSVGGMTQLNNVITVVSSVVDSTNFTIPINTSAYSAFSGSGSVALAEVFLDNYDGTLTSNLGGTGTINYSTRVYSITFNTAPINTSPINFKYYWEDSLTQGIFDFTFSGTRTNGQGSIFTQFDGSGALYAVWPIADVEYCFHTLKVYQLQLTSNDTNANNLVYRQNVGIPYWRAAWPTGDGIVYLDIFNQVQPKIRALELTQATTNTNPTITPVSLSDALDISGYGFDKCVVFEFGDYYMVFAKNTTNGVVDSANDICFLYNKISGFWDILDYKAACAAIYNGTLLLGDSISPNVFTVFSGYDDDGDVITNHWKESPNNLGIEGQKSFMKFRVRGKIQRSQKIDVYFSYDGGNPIKVYTITGTGTGVNLGNQTTVGSYTVGSKIYGGGGTISAFSFEVEFPVGSPRFEYVQVMFQATDIGWAEIDEYAYMDNRFKSQRTLPGNIASPIT